MALKRFTYTKDSGEISNRTVFVISEPSDLLRCIDLSEFDPEERDHYESVLMEIQNEFLESISEVGLKNNWRSFKKSGISPLKVG